jgi:16S rRNA (cytosine1402-N4)-methyltransferase
VNDAVERHVPVMLDRCVELLLPALDSPGAIAVDATLGLGGHSEALLASNPGARLVGIDRDGEAIRLATERLAPFGSRFVAHRAKYDDVSGALKAIGANRADAILFDLGVSSMQIDQAERGFSYAADAPLDMRMNTDDPRTAADLVRDEDESSLARILAEYGEERYAPRIARAIVRRRGTTPITRTGDLVEIVRAAIPAAARAKGGNPAKRTFQALRIAVNDELGILARAIPAAVEATAVGGRIVVLSYHSLEDRLVKRAFAAGAEDQTPRLLPLTRDEDRPYLRLLTRGAEKASDVEAERNPRSASVRLRAVERIRETPPSRKIA